MVDTTNTKQPGAAEEGVTSSVGTRTTDTTCIVVAALRYAEEGFPVFPLVPGEKRPLTSNGFHDATSDADQIREWWNKCPDANIGLATGLLSGLVAIDVDVKGGKPGHASFASLNHDLNLPSTRTSRTPSGGSHVFFRLQEGQEVRSRVNIAPGIDVRGDGGYVVAPPSRIGGSRYEWVDDLQIAPAPATLIEFCSDGSRSPREDSDVYPIREGERNDRLFHQAVELRRSGTANELVSQIIYAFNASLCVPPLPQDEIEQLLASSEKYAEPESSEPGTVASKVVDLVSEAATLFHHGREAFVSVSIGDHEETYRLRSNSFRNWAAHATFERYGFAPTDRAMGDALQTLEGKALYAGDDIPVSLRVAKHGDDYYIDLGNESWNAVRVSSDRWEIVKSPPVKFWRTNNTAPLPTPIQGGQLKDLRQLVNIKKGDLPLLLTWMLDAFRPDTPYPVLELQGEQGSAKSTTQARIRRLIDPNRVNLLTPPRGVEDAFICARNNHVVSYNNLSALSPEMQDAICSMSTGGGYGRRALYQDEEEAVTNVTKPVIINGIGSLVSAPDLIDRTLSFELPRISPDKRKTESDLDKEFSELAPRVFGAILNAFVGALRELPLVNPKPLPRMADFGKLGVAVCRSQGWPVNFLEIYSAHQRELLLLAIEASPVALAVQALAAAQGGFDGTVGDLFTRLSLYRQDGEGWPRSPRGLTNVLRRQGPALSQLGILVEVGSRSSRGRSIRITSRVPGDTPGNRDGRDGRAGDPKRPRSHG